MTEPPGPAPASMLPVLAVMLPLAGALLGPLIGARAAERLTLALVPAGLAIGTAVAIALLRSGEALVDHIGGWTPPLGIAFRADGLAAAMLLTTAVVVGATALYARRAGLGTARGMPEERAPLAFWSLLPALWAAVACAVVNADLFGLFVALEMLTFAAVPLVCLDGTRATMEAALRYLLFALLGSVLYLLGAALLYGAYGTLDIVLLSGLVRPDAATMAAAALMTAGLMAKTALFPLHLWLPPAHAGAPAAASAVLSALVVKASFVILVRLWFGALHPLLGPAVAQMFGALGAAAILVGGVMALRQARLKLLVAWSTVAQIGYLMLMVPLAAAGGGTEAGSAAWLGGMLQALSHALAKAGMFLAAGTIALALGHDRLDALGGAARAAPLAVLAFALGGLSLVGVPPSGGFAAKWLLLTSAIALNQWWWTLAIVGGGLLTGGYLYRVLSAALAGDGGAAVVRSVPRVMEAVPLALVLLSVGLGLLPIYAFGLAQIGRLDLDVAP